MPIFDFECKKCGQEFEKLVKTSDILPECIHCGSKDTKKKPVQAINFELKGVGVYKNGTN